MLVIGAVLGVEDVDAAWAAGVEDFEEVVELVSASRKYVAAIGCSSPVSCAKSVNGKLVRV